MKKTGWPPGLLQDDCSKLSRWFASRIDARETVRRVFRQEKGKDMTDEISIKTIEPTVEEVCLPKVKTGGWMMFYRYPNTMHWMYGMPPFDSNGNRDTIRFPHPLFMSKDEALDEARKRLSYGGDVKLFRVDL